MDDITEALQRALGEPGAGVHPPICVALSGGLDSTVLLHALVAAGYAPRVRAVYIDHALHSDSAAWGRHCAALCAGLGVPFASRAVDVDVTAGEGLEAAARAARYAALAAGLAPDEVLVTAHHRDDQAETVLINMLRGAGPAGLAGMPRAGRTGAVRLVRPLLDVPRSRLESYGRDAGLAWIDDPANADPRLDRNFLRHEVLPRLSGRWPAAATTLARSARLCGEAAELLDELGAADVRRSRRGGRLSVAALLELSEARRRNALRHACREQLGCVPTEGRLREGLAQLLGAGPDRRPLLAWPGGEVRRYQDRLYVQPPLGEPPSAARELLLPARSGARLELGGATGRLRLVRSPGRGLALAALEPELAVRFRVGGERIRPAGQAHRRELKKLLQERGIVPWMRGHVPLLYSGRRLAAVAGLWVAAEFAASAAEPGLRVRWDAHAAIE